MRRLFLLRGFSATAFDLVVAAGGDGTINEVAIGFVGRSIPLGLIPMGTAICESLAHITFVRNCVYPLPIVPFYTSRAMARKNAAGRRRGNHVE